MTTYVPVAVAVELALTETFWLAGVVQPLTVLKLTVWLPTDRLPTVAPLLCSVPPSTCHCAPAEIAPAGLIVTCREPVCGLGISKELKVVDEFKASRSPGGVVPGQSYCSIAHVGHEPIDGLGSIFGLSLMSATQRWYEIGDVK